MRLFKGIAALQRKIADAKKDEKYWDTVFWATCWIPFANIGTGVKKGNEDAKCKAKVKTYEEDRRRKISRIDDLTRRLREIEVMQSKNNESSGKLADQITATEGQVSQVTNTLNDLRHEIALWSNISEVCSKIQVELQYTNGKIEKVMEYFYQLMQISELMSAPLTDKFIKNCTCKGDRLSTGQRLKRNEYLLSKNHRFVLVMQSDNSLVMYNSEKAIWDTRTWGACGDGFVELDADGIVSVNYKAKRVTTE